MQFIKLASSAAFVASALGYKIMLYTNDVNEILFNHAGLSPIHEGAGVNYVTIGSSAEALEYDEANGLIYKEFSGTEERDGYRLYLDYIENNGAYKGYPFLQISAINPTHKWSIEENNVLKVADNEYVKFYAAQNVSDPYNMQDTWFAGAGNKSAFEGKASNINEIYIIADQVAVL